MTRTISIASALVLIASSTALADVHDLELTIPIGIADRSSAGGLGAPAGYGYDNEAGALGGLEGRLYFALNSYFHLGAALGAQHHAGPFFGAIDDHAFRTTVLDAGLAARGLLPCLSRGDLKWYVGGVLAVSGVYANAGTGVGGRANGPDAEARALASRTLDHGGLGWRLAFDLSWSVGAFVFGVGLGARQFFAIDAEVTRTWLMDLGVRLGGRFDLFTPPQPV